MFGLLLRAGARALPHVLRWGGGLLAFFTVGGYVAEKTGNVVNGVTNNFFDKLSIVFSFFIPHSYLGIAMYAIVLLVCLFFVFAKERASVAKLLFVFAAILIASSMEKGFSHMVEKNNQKILKDDQET